MGNVHSDTKFQAMIVGDKADSFIRYIETMLNKCNVAFISCSDVYSAMAKLACHEDTNGILVVGRIEKLNIEKESFFQKVSQKGGICCCLSFANSTREYLKSVSEIGTEAIVINEPAEFEQVIHKVLSCGFETDQGKNEKPYNSFFMKDEFLETKAEIDALLGNYISEKRNS